MTTVSHPSHPIHIDVAGTDLVFRRIALDDHTPTGTQIASAAGFAPARHAAVLQLLDSGEMEDIRPDETVELRQDGSRFIVVESDRSYHFLLDGRRFDWPKRIVSGAALRKLGSIPADLVVYLERRDEPDRLVRDSDLIDLDEAGVEAFNSRAQTWILIVQGERLEVETPTIVVRDALVRAGFNALENWHIFLKLAGQPKQPMTLDSVIDLRRPGIEKLRLVPKDVTNGEGATRARREFRLLETDEAFLDRWHGGWETVVDAGRRWLLLAGYSLPAGYSASVVTLALEIPPAYPGGEIDMFYVSPVLTLVSGSMAQNTEARVMIGGCEYQRWSRHRTVGAPWRPESDNVMTHLALVEAALAIEVGQ